MIRIGVAGLGKMGISHLALLRAHPDVEVSAVADSSRFARDMLAKYTGLTTHSSLEELLDEHQLDAVAIATPSHLHAPMVRAALERGVHVFCEKPFCLDPLEGERLAATADGRGLVNQVGYHYRFVATFAEARMLVRGGSLGELTHLLAEAYGPVVLRQTGGTWRSRDKTGGGCLYDYAAHPVDLVRWFAGEVRAVSGSVLRGVFSSQTNDEVLSTLHLDHDVHAQLSVSWSDESRRKMSTKLSAWGTHGHLEVDRQGLRVYLRPGAPRPEGYGDGWNVRDTTSLTPAVWYYLRGEEYSAQIDHFATAVNRGVPSGAAATFQDATGTDRVLAMIAADARMRDLLAQPADEGDEAGLEPRARRPRRLLGAKR